MRTLAVCVATSSGPESLQRLLAALAWCDVPAGVELQVRVADNDAHGSMRSLVSDASSLFAHPIVYTIEPRPGVVHIRNCLIELGPADLVTFIDDDEWPDPQWLSELTRVHDESGAAVVIGPVRAALPPHAPRWLREGRMLDSGRPEGAAAGPAHWTEGGTGNVLYAGRLFYEEGFRFNPVYGATGGEDADLAARLHLAGHRTHYAPNAVVHEAVPAERMALEWLVRRRIRAGRNLERIHASMPGGGGWRWTLMIPRRLGLGLWRLVRSLPRVAAGHPADACNALLDLCVLAGRIQARVVATPPKGPAC